jgi:hypothetical protein
MSNPDKGQDEESDWRASQYEPFNSQTEDEYWAELAQQKA